MSAHPIRSRLREQSRVLPGRFRPFFLPVCVMSGVYALGICAILRANYDYIDDLQRVHTGIGGWGDAFSRYLSDLLAPLIHGKSYLTDVSPLPQLLACVLLAAASVIVLYLVTGRTRYTVWEYAAVLPLGLSPYMLECLSFKYDAPYMALSVLASVAPLLAVKAARPGRALIACCFLGTLAMCSTYQAASGILPMFVVLLAFRQWSEGQSFGKVLRFIAAAAAGYCAAIILYKFLLVHPSVLDYANTAMTPLGRLVPQATGTFRAYLAAIWADLDWKWLLLVAAVCLAFLWAAVRDTARSRFAAAALALVCLALLVLLSFGLYPLLEKPLIRPRTMYGLGAAVAFAAVPAASARRLLPAKLACLALAWCFFLFAFTYGNALYCQKEYTDFRIREVIDALKEPGSSLYEPPDTVFVQLKGDIGMAPAIRGTVQAFPLLEKLVPATFGDYSWMTYYGFANYYGLPKLSWTGGGEVDLANFHLPLLDESIYHTIYGSDYFLLIELK